MPREQSQTHHNRLFIHNSFNQPWFLLLREFTWENSVTNGMYHLSSILSTRKPTETGACAPPSYLTAEHERKRTVATYKFTLAHQRWKALEVPQRRRHHVDTHRHKTHRSPAARAPLSAWQTSNRDESRDRVRGARCIQIARQVFHPQDCWCWAWGESVTGRSSV